MVKAAINTSGKLGEKLLRKHYIMNPKEYPLISICVINYNGSEYLPACIGSILGQTYPNIEIVFCDDASTDDSIKVFEALIKEHGKILIKREYRNMNGGAEHNMIAGLKSFSGDYVCNIDSDDILRKDHLEVLYNLITESGADISCTNHVDFVDGDFDYKAFNQATSEVHSNYTKHATADALQTFFLKEQVLPFAYWHRLYKRAASKRIADLPSSYFLNSDSAFSLPQFCETKTVAFLDIATYAYRIRPQSISHKSWYGYLQKKTLHSLDRICNHYSGSVPALTELNEYRNLKTVALMLDACIKEKCGLSEFSSCYKKYVNGQNKTALTDMLTADLKGAKRVMIRLMFRTSPNVYYFFQGFLFKRE